MSADKTQPFGEHVREIRQRLFYCAAIVVAGCIAGYIFRDPLFEIINKPLGQQLYYTSPVGGLNAIFKLSALVGLIVGAPFLVYQLCQFLSPAFRNLKGKQPIQFLIAAILLAAAGVAFGYFVCLPASLKFLTNVGGQDFEALIVVNDYLNFVFAYLLGFAILFQLPLVMLFINKISPQKPSKLFKQERWVILISFILAAILTPTPDPLNQILMAIPVIILFQVSIGLIWWQNRRLKQKDSHPLQASA